MEIFTAVIESINSVPCHAVAVKEHFETIPSTENISLMFYPIEVRRAAEK